MMSLLFKKVRKKILAVAFMMLAGFGISCGCWYFLNEKSARLEPAAEIALEWNRFFLEAERYTEGYRAPVMARTCGYIGLAAYQTALPALSEKYVSIAPKFAGLHLPPLPETYDLPAALNACYFHLFHKFFFTAPEGLVKKAEALSKSFHHTGGSSHADMLLFQRSVTYGRQVAQAVADWSATDKAGYQGDLHNFDRNYMPPIGQGLWVVATEHPMPPLLPYWGQVRPFLIQTDSFLARPLPAYSTDPASEYYREALELYTISRPLSTENQWIAEFWSDDHHGLTFSPATRWISVANQVIEIETPDAGKVLETYLKIGFSIADASIACWKSKYIYNLERPETYIQQTMDASWRPHTESPAFPSYPSGHSMMGAAAAEVLTRLYGSRYRMEDRSHTGRTEFNGTPRHFNSFYEMAYENAFSRVVLGVHFRMDCEEGVRLGFGVGKAAADLDVLKPRGKDFFLSAN